MTARLRRLGALLSVIATASGCSGGAEVSLLECQLAVQKGNAGRSDQDKAEKARDVESCMDARGFRLVSDPATCRGAVTKADCYRAR